MYKQLTLEKLSEYSCYLYVIALYLFADNAKYIIIANICFILFAGFAILNILYRGTLAIGPFLWMPLLYITYSLCSVFWSVNSSYAYSKCITLVQLFIFLILVFNTFYEKDGIDTILRSLVIAGLLLSIYSILTYGLGTILKAADSTNIRLGNDISQANTFGMMLAITVVLCFHYYINSRRKVMLLLAVIPFIMSLLSGSRKAVLIIVIGVLALVFVNYGFKKFYKIFFTIIAIIVIGYIVIKLPFFNTIYYRLEGMINLFTGQGVADKSAMVRKLLVEQGLKWFINKPLIGYGLANYRILFLSEFGSNIYSHNNYIEILVNQGLVGFILFYAMPVYVLYNLMPDVLKKKSEVLAVSVIIVIRLIMDYGSVSYDSKIFWLYLAIGFVLVYQCKK